LKAAAVRVEGMAVVKEQALAALVRAVATVAVVGADLLVEEALSAVAAAAAQEMAGAEVVLVANRRGQTVATISISQRLRGTT
jgi:hypothetical protein